MTNGPAGTAKQAVFESWDVGNYRQLNAQLRVMIAGTGGTLTLQHAAINREEAFVDIPGVSVNLNVAGDTFREITGFLRFVRWSYTGATGNPMALIDAVAKD